MITIIKVSLIYITYIYTENHSYIIISSKPKIMFLRNLLLVLTKKIHFEKMHQILFQKIDSATSKLWACGMMNFHFYKTLIIRCVWTEEAAYTMR